MIAFDNQAEYGTVTCDECGDEDEFQAVDWTEFLEIVRANGWWIRRRAGMYEHYCYNCNLNS